MKELLQRCHLYQQNTISHPNLLWGFTLNLWPFLILPLNQFSYNLEVVVNFYAIVLLLPISSTRKTPCINNSIFIQICMIVERNLEIFWHFSHQLLYWSQDDIYGIQVDMYSPHDPWYSFHLIVSFYYFGVISTAYHPQNHNASYGKY